MPPPIDVDTSAYESARDIFFDVDSHACDAVLIAASGAGDGGGMAGSDSSGVDWARQYDAAAGQALQAGSTLADTLGHLGELLDQSGANHANADASSIPGGGGSPNSGGATGPSGIYPATPPSANGTPGNEPHGWFLIAHLMSWTWPNGHQDQLRSVGSAWTRAGQALQNDSSPITTAISEIETVQSPEVPAAVQACRDAQAQMNELGTEYTNIGQTCNNYAGYLDQAHREVIDELESLLAWTAGIEAAGALAGIFTLGGAEVPAQAVEAGRIARTAARVGEILSKMAELVRGAMAIVARAAGRIGEILGKLKGLLGKGVTRALARVGTRLPGAGRASADVRKFSEYIFKAGAKHGKDAVFRSYGYGAGDSEKLVSEFERQATAKFRSGEYTLGKADQYGQRLNITITLEGQGAAEGKTAEIVTGWMIREDGSLTLNTPFGGFAK